MSSKKHFFTVYQQRQFPKRQSDCLSSPSALRGTSSFSCFFFLIFVLFSAWPNTNRPFSWKIFLSRKQKGTKGKKLSSIFGLRYGPCKLRVGNNRSKLSCTLVSQQCPTTTGKLVLSVSNQGCINIPTTRSRSNLHWGRLTDAGLPSFTPADDKQSRLPPFFTSSLSLLSVGSHRASHSQIHV